MDKKGWIFIALALISTAVTFSVPLPSPMTNIYADQRTFLGIPNFNDVVSNIPFLILGAMGLWARRDRGLWVLFFLAIVAVGFGSGYYHLKPSAQTLVWDRLPIGLAFTALLSAVLAERVSLKWMRELALILVLVGMGSVFFWVKTGDERPYLLVEYFPILALPLLCFFFPRPVDKNILWAVVFYILAKLFEVQDDGIFNLTDQTISGHTLKHLAAAAGVYFIYRKATISYNVAKTRKERKHG